MTTKHSTEIDYGYANGLNIEKTIFKNNQIIGHITPNTSIDALQKPISQEILEKHLRTFKKNAGKIAVQMSMFESENPDGTLNVILTGWQGNWNNKLARNEMRYVIANQNPQADVLFINHAGQGESDTLPSHISKEVAQTGKFQPLGEIYTDSLKNILPDYDKVSIAGHSYGGRIAIALAASLDKQPTNLVISDSPGSKDLGGAIGVIKAFGSEGPHKTGYDKNNSGDNLDVQLEFDKHPIKNLSEYISHSGWDGLVQLFNHQPSSLSKPTLEHDLLLAAPNIKEKIRLTSPEFSKYNNPETVANILKRVSTANKALRIDLDILKNHSHAFTSGHPDVFGYIMQL